MEQNTTEALASTQELLNTDVTLAINGEEKDDTNVKTFLAPVEKAQEMHDMKQDFLDYLKNMPRKLKRRVYDDKKFGNALEVKLREQRLVKATKKDID